MIEKYILNIKEASFFIGISTSQIKRLIEINDFVTGVQITHRRVGYLKSDLKDWIDSRPKITSPEVVRIKKKVCCPSTTLEVDQAYDQELAELKARRGNGNGS